jgi:hypothetical protein
MRNPASPRGFSLPGAGRRQMLCHCEERMARRGNLNDHGALGEIASLRSQ